MSTPVVADDVIEMVEYYPDMCLVNDTLFRDWTVHECMCTSVHVCVIILHRFHC